MADSTALAKLDKSEAIEMIREQEKTIDKLKEKGKGLAAKAAPIAPLASGFVATSTAFAVGMAEGAKTAPGAKDEHKGLIAIPTAIGGVVLAIVGGKNHPIIAGGGEAVAIGSACAFAALEGHDQGVSARLKMEQARIKREQAARDAAANAPPAKS